MFRLVIGVIVGAIIVYLCCALIAWNLNPAQWGWGLRLWFMLWTIPWGWLCSAFVIEVFAPRAK